MTDNDIIKALECCGKNPPVCHECKYKGKCNRIDCYDYLKRDVLDLINRQKAEIESKNDLIHRQSDVISEQKEKLESIYSEAIKEFIKRFEKKIKDVKFTIGQTWEIKSALKEAKKEMVGEEDD